MAAVPLLQEFWIVTKDGLTVYNQQLEDDVNPGLLGSFLTAINQLARQIGDGLCKSMNFGTTKLTFTYCSDTGLMLVGRSQPQVKESAIKDYLVLIRDRFLDRYKFQLKDWDGNMAIFNEVDEIVNLKSDKQNWLGVNLTKELSQSVINQL